VPGKAGTLETMTRSLALALAPLEEKLAPDNAVAFFTELGLRFPPQVLQPQLVGALNQAVTGAAALPDTVARLTTSIENDDEAGILVAGTQLVAQLVALASALDDIGTQLGALAGTIPGVPAADVTAFADELPGKLLSYGLVTAAEQRAAGVVGVANLLGIVDYVPHGDGGDAAHPFYVERRLQVSRLSGLLSKPLDVFAAIYDWGQPGFDGTKLISRVGTSLDLLGINALTDAAGTSLTSGLLALEAAPPGLDATLHESLGSGLDLTLPITETTSVRLHVQGEFAAELVALITPPATVNVTPPTGTLEGEAGIEIRAQGADAAHPLILVGQTGGSVIQADAVTLGVAVILTWNEAAGTAAAEPNVSIGIVNGKVVIDLSSGDGFIAAIAGGGNLSANVDFKLHWSPSGGASIEGSAAIEIAIPTHVTVGPIEIQQLYLKLGLGPDGSLPGELSAAFGASLGPLQASVDRIGLTVTTTFPDHGGNLGPANLALGFKPPSGVGLSINAGVVTGGGFLYIDAERGEYAGALQLSIADFLSVSAIGLITTRMPDGSAGFSLLIIITADFGSGIQLGFGFTLNAVGGLIGLNRTMLFQPVMDGVRTGAIESVMFPRDVVANAPRIISDLRTLFPPQQGTFLIGPMAKLGWGEPTLVRLSLGVIVLIPPGDIAILGVLKVALPAEELPVLVLQVNFAGAFEFDKQRFYFFASLYDSHILFITIEGELGVLFVYGADANLVLTVGGFHPQFNPPPLPFPSPRRIQVNVLNESYARIRCDGYFAVTTNTAQFGAHAEFFFGFSALSVEGHSGFDALFQFSPFHFTVTISTSFSVKVFGLGVYGVDIDLTVDGPTPWHAHGRASISFFFFSIGIGIDFTWGDSRETSLPAVPVMPILAGEFEKQSNWRAVLPTGSNLRVSLRALDPSESEFVLHPVGTLQIEQRAVPLDLVLDKVGSQKPSDANRFSLGVTSPALAKTRDLQEAFAPAQFKDFDAAARLSQPAYAPEDSGIELAAAGHTYASATAITRIVRYDLTIIDTKLRRFSQRFFVYTGALFAHFLAGASVAHSPLSAYRKAQTHPFDETVAVKPETFAVALGSNNTVFNAEAASFSSRASAKDYLDRAVAADPSLAATLHVLPQFEVAA
jgi:hypothetical protein